MTPIAHNDVQAELERVLASKGFAGAERQRRMLRYIVEQTLAGRTDELKEYAVGIEVFDRDEKYDPRLDSIVRVEAGRLRSRLDEYYNGEGAAAPVRITLPRGGYVAHFEPRQAPAPAAAMPEQARRSWASWPLTAALIVAVAAMVVWLGGWNRTPAQTDNADVAVLPFTSEPGDEPLAARLTEGVTAELARLGTVSVVSYTSARQFGGSDRRSLREIAGTLNADYAIEATIEREPQGILLVVRVVDALTDRKVWVADYHGAAEDVRGISQRMAFEIGAEVVRRR